MNGVTPIAEPARKAGLQKDAVSAVFRYNVSRDIVVVSVGERYAF